MWYTIKTVAECFLILRAGARVRFGEHDGRERHIAGNNPYYWVVSDDGGGFDFWMKFAEDGEIDVWLGTLSEPT